MLSNNTVFLKGHTSCIPSDKPDPMPVIWYSNSITILHFSKLLNHARYNNMVEVISVANVEQWYTTQCEWTSRFTVHYLRWRLPPFMRQCWGLPHRLAQSMSLQGWGKLVNAALLSLINEVCVNAALPSAQVNSSAPLVCRHDRATREAGRVGLVGRDRGRKLLSVT